MGNIARYKIVLGVIIVVLFVTVITFSVLVYRDAGISIKDPQVTNVTDTALTLTWTSDEEYIGIVYYKQESDWKWWQPQGAGGIAYDDRDIELDEDANYVQVEGGAKARYTHHVTLRNLKPQTVYSLRVGGSVFGRSVDVEVKTANLIDDLNTPDPAYGSIEGGKTDDSIVFIKNTSPEDIEDVTVFSAPVAVNNTYSLDMNLIKQESDITARDLVAVVKTGKDTTPEIVFEQEGYKPLEKIILGTSDGEQDNSLDKSILDTTYAAVDDFVTKQPKQKGELCVAGDAYANPSSGGCDGPGYTYETDGNKSLGCIPSSPPVAVEGKTIGKCQYKGDGSAGQDQIQQLINSVFNQPGSEPAAVAQTGYIGAATQPLTQDQAEQLNDQIVPAATEQPGGDGLLNGLDRSNIPIPANGSTYSFEELQGVFKQIGQSIGLPENTVLSGNYGGPAYGMAVRARKTTPPTVLVRKNLGQLAKEKTVDLLTHEGWHIKQSECRDNLPSNIHWAREFSADAMSSNGGGYRFFVTLWAKCFGTDQKFGWGNATGIVSESNLLKQLRFVEAYNCQETMSDKLREYITSGCISVSAITPYKTSESSGSQSIPSENTRQVAEIEGGALVKGVSAQAEEDQIDQSGTYSFFVDGELRVQHDIEIQDGEGAIDAQYYLDQNGNGIQDEGEEIIEKERITFEREATFRKYSLNAGWNLINFPLLESDGRINSASYWMAHFSELGVPVTRIAKFDAGKFQIYTESEYGNDFDILHGQSVFVFTQQAADFRVNGYEAEQSIPLILNNGWNLVGFVAPGQSYTSENLISKMDAAGIKTDTISHFENGLYQSVVKDDGTLFGNNFNVIDSKGYFVRVDSGGGKKFTP